MRSPPRSLSELEFTRRERLVLYYMIGLVVVVLAYTVMYNQALSRLEGVNQSIFASLEFVIQTMTTTGYGQDSGQWSHPLMFLLVSLTQVTGIGIGFFTLRMIIIPLFTGAEVNLDNRLTPKEDHVIVCEYRRDSAVLLDELDELDIEYVLLSSSRENAKALSDDGFSAIHGSPQDAETFERANIDSARAVITDTGEENVNTILTVRSIRRSTRRAGWREPASGTRVSESRRVRTSSVPGSTARYNCRRTRTRSSDRTPCCWCRATRTRWRRSAISPARHGPSPRTTVSSSPVWARLARPPSRSSPRRR